MITYPKTILAKRWNSMSENIREALYTPGYGETILEIAEDHNFDKRKSETLMRLVAFVFYGFIHPEELDKKIVKEIGVDKRIASDISEEIDRKLLYQFREEINKLYSPVSETVGQVESILPPKKAESKLGDLTITKDENKVGAAPSIPEEPEKKTGEPVKLKNSRPSVLKPETEEKSTNKSKNDQPFVIHKEEGGAPRIAGGSEKKDFRFSLGDFFKNKKRGEDSDGISARIESPFKKDEGKTVHYSEYQSDSDFDNKSSFINVPQPEEPKPIEKPEPALESDDKNGKVDVAPEVKKEEPVVKVKDFKEEPEDSIPEDKGDEGGPNVEGNTIDLRNL